MKICIRPFLISFFILISFVPTAANALTIADCVIRIAGFVKMAPDRNVRNLKPQVEGLEERIDPALIDPVYGNTVREVIEVLNANTRQPVVNAEVTVSTEGTVYPGGKGTTGVDGIFRGVFENTDDVFGYQERTVYVPPTYEYHYGYNPATGNYEYFYGYNENGGYYKQEIVPVYDYTTRYQVTVKAPGFDPLSQFVDVNFKQSPSLLKASLALTLERPPQYAAAFASGLVETVLHRTATSDDIATLSNALRSQTPSQVALSVLQTNDSKSALVGETYQYYVGGVPPAKLQRDLMQGLVSTNNEDGLVVKVIVSAQYSRTHFGTRPRRLAQSIYESLLGRQPNNRELRSATAQVSRANTKQSLVIQLVKSPEYRVRQISLWSQTYLGTNLDANFTKQLLQQWSQGGTTLSIRAQILGKRVP